MLKYDDMYYACWLIERFGRAFDMPRKDVVNLIGKKRLKNYMEFADCFHCENPDKIIGELAEELGVIGNDELFKYIEMQSKPSLRQIAGVYARVIKMCHENDYEAGIEKFFNSFLPPLINDYENNLYWSSMHYLSECYKDGNLL